MEGVSGGRASVGLGAFPGCRVLKCEWAQSKSVGGDVFQVLPTETFAFAGAELQGPVSSLPSGPPV